MKWKARFFTVEPSDVAIMTEAVGTPETSFTTIQEVLADIITQISTDNEVEGEVLAVEPSDVAIMPEAVGIPETSFVAQELERRKQAEAKLTI